jgi:hypothetical protein
MPRLSDIESAVERVSEELSKLAKDVETKEQIASTASISPMRWTRSARKA